MHTWIRDWVSVSSDTSRELESWHSWLTSTRAIPSSSGVLSRPPKTLSLIARKRLSSAMGRHSIIPSDPSCQALPENHGMWLLRRLIYLVRRRTLRA